MKKKLTITNSLRARKPAAPVTNKSSVECQGCRIEVQWNEKDEAATVAILDTIGKDPWSDGGFTEKDFRNALKDIPATKTLNLLINSRGGDVFEGFGIKNAIAEWPNRVTATITGVAASTASWMILDADEVRAPKASQMFIHEAMTIGAGNAEDLREVADRLDTTSEQIAGFYAAKNGKPVAEMRELMKKNTLMTGAQARELGLVDVLTDEAPTNNFTETDLSAMRQRLVMLNSAPVQGAKTTNTNNAQPKRNTVNRENKLALLKEWGVSYENTISDADLDALIAKGKPATTTATNTADARVIALENRLREAETRRVTSEFNEIAKTRPTINREEWLPKVIADPSLLNSLRDFPEAPEPMAIGGFNRIENKGNPLIEEWNKLEFDKIGRAKLARENYGELRNQLIKIQNIKLDPVYNANTVDSSLANTILTGDFITTMRTKTAMLGSFGHKVEIAPLAPRDTIKVELVSSAGGVNTNPSNFETGDTTSAPVTVSVSHINRNFHVSMAERNVGLALLQKAPTSAAILSEGLVAICTALMTNANFGADVVIGAATSFNEDDLAAILRLGKNYGKIGLLLDGDHYYGLAPRTRDNFKPTEGGQYMFDGGIWKNNLWTGGATDICGLVYGPDAIVWGAAPTAELPQGDFLSTGSIPLDCGVTVQVFTWFSRATRAMWSSFDVCFGAAVGDATQAEVLTTQ